MDRYQDEMAPATALLFLDKAPEDIPVIALELCQVRLSCAIRGNFISSTLPVFH